MDGTSILIKLNLPILLDKFPMKAMGLPARLKWIWGAYRYCVHEDSGLMVPMVDMVLALMPPVKRYKKLSNLKTWSGAPVILGLLGKEAM